MADSLCQICRRIDFASLRGPSSSVVDDLYARRISKDVYSSQTDDATSRIVLGPLKRLRRDASQCPLCSLFCHVIDRQGALSGSNKSLSARDVCFEALAGGTNSYFGRITTIEPAQPWNIVLRRLTLNAYSALEAGGSGELLANFAHVFHTRIPGSQDPPIEGRSYEAAEVPSTMLFGARNRPLQIDIHLIRSWIDICSKEHGPRCADTLGRDTDRYSIRFIDVIQMSIVTMRDSLLSDFRYVALSYVWGPPQYHTAKLLSSNVSELGSDGALRSMLIPQTIKDAMELTRLIGFRYLWVDALCIKQDDDNDKGDQIANMHGVYKTAFATIIAASGAHSDSGLPGLRPNSRHYEQREIVVIDPSDEDPGLSLVTTVKDPPRSWNSSYVSGHGPVELSAWNNRAWTMQERALSRRTIIFTEEQVLWDCPCAFFCEEAFFEVRNLRYRSFTNSSFQDLSLSSLAQSGSPWGLYRRLVSQYSQRSLSFEGDYMNAFAAIFEMISETKGERFFWGLPRSRFDLALSWDTIYGVHKRIETSTLPITSLNQRIQFPSWSWLGWVGHARCSVGDDRIESESTTVMCYTHRSNPLAFVPVCQLDKASSYTYHRPDSTVEISDVELHLPGLIQRTLVAFPDEYLLFFWAESARFFVQPPDPTTFTEHKSVYDNVHDSRPVIYDADGKKIGTAGRLQRKHWASNAGGFTPQWHEFIAIGRREIPEIPEYPIIILALQIQRADNVAQRVNIAEISKEAWVEASPRRVLVVLA